MNSQLVLDESDVVDDGSVDLGDVGHDGVGDGVDQVGQSHVEVGDVTQDLSLEIHDGLVQLSGSH